jgi:hypothetical protein
MFARIQTFVAVFACTACLTAAPPQNARIGKDTGELTDATFAKFHKELQPPKDELWRSIPWHASILEGREQAAREKKPIFVWVASGEPLGCG